MAAFVESRNEEMRFAEDKEKSVDLPLLDELNENNLNFNVLQKSNEFHEASESEPPLMSKTSSIMLGENHGTNDLLNSEDSTTDYDWLLSPPRNSIPSMSMEEQKTFTSQNVISSAQPTAPDSRLENLHVKKTSTTYEVAKRPTSNNGVKSSTIAIRKPSPSRKPISPATPTTRSTLPSTSKPLRSSTPTSRATTSSTKPVAPQKRSSTPTSSARSSTPTACPSIVTASNSKSRSSTPTQRPSNPSRLPTTLRSSSVTKSRTPILKNQASSCGTSPSVKSRPLKNPLEMPKISNEASSNLKKSLPSTETNSKSMPKRSSSKGIANNSLRYGITRNNRSSDCNDDVNPVLMGTKMVERVVNMRKLAPPKHEDHLSNQNNNSLKSSSLDNSGFGRTLSKKSFDMALRHMDIRRSMPGNMRAMITKIPASSVYSVGSESTKSRAISALDSPLATSSNTSSEHSVN